MAKLVWDQVGQKTYETGTDHAVLFPMQDNGTYGAGVAWNGITGFTESPSGAENTDLWADNIKYVSLRSAEDYGATIEAYTYPDEFKPCIGEAEVATGVNLGQQKRRISGLPVQDSHTRWCGFFVLSRFSRTKNTASPLAASSPPKIFCRISPSRRFRTTVPRNTPGIPPAMQRNASRQGSVRNRVRVAGTQDARK